MKKLLSVLLAVSMILSVSALSITSIASDVEVAISKLPEANIVDLKFGDKTVTDVSDPSVVGTPKITEFSSGNNARDSYTNFGDVSFEYNGLSYTEKGFFKTASGNTVCVNFEDVTNEYKAALAAGFTLEVAFVMPSVSGSASWGSATGSAIIGATSGGGFVLGRTGDGKIFWVVDNSAGTYVNVTSTDKFEVGDFVHAVCTFDGTAITLTVNGKNQGTAACSGIKTASLPAKYIGIGGSLASATNVTNFACGGDLGLVEFKMYNKALSTKQATIAFDKYMNGLVGEVKESAPVVKSGISRLVGDIIDLEFENANVRDVSPDDVVGHAKITEYSSGNNARASFTNFGDRKYTVNGKEYTAKSFYKNSGSPTNCIMLDFSAVKDAYGAALKDGFTLETSFALPADRGTSGATNWGSSPKGHAIVGATSGGGYVLGVSSSVDTKGYGYLFFSIQNGSGYSAITSTNKFNQGDYIHAVCTFDATAKKIYLYVNGVLEGSADAAKLNLGSLPASYCGIGGSLGGETNPTNYACASLEMNSFKLHNDVFGENQVKAAYAYNLENLGVYTDDIINLKFGDAKVTDVSPDGVVGHAKITEYSGADKPRASFTNFGDKTYTVDGKQYTAKSFYKNGSTQDTVMLDFSGVKSAYGTAMKDGFTLETSFALPADSTTTDAATWGPSPKGHAIVGATNGGGFVLGISSSKDTNKGYGYLFFSIHNGSGYSTVTSTNKFNAGDYIHAVCTFDATAKKIYLYVNGALEGSVDAAALSLGSLPASYCGIGGSIRSATAPVNYACNNLEMNSFKLSDSVYGQTDVTNAYYVNLAKLGAIKIGTLNEEEPAGPVEPEPDTLGEDILELAFAKNAVYPVQYSVSKPEIYEYSASGKTKATFENVGMQTVTINGIQEQIPGFKSSSKTNQIGITLDKTKLTEALSKGFTLETSFVMPEKTSASQAIIGATTGGGFGLFLKSDGTMTFEVGKQSSGYADCIFTPPAAGTYVHFVGTFDGSNLHVYVNGEDMGSVACPGFRAGGYFGCIGIGGSTASATNFSNYGLPITVTSLHIYSNALSASAAFGAYEKHMGKFGYEITKKVLDDDFEPVLRFFVTSDIHISSEGDARCNKLANLIGDMYTIADNAGNSYRSVDALCIAGDIGDNGKRNQEQWVMDTLSASLKDETQALITCGNHDYYEGNSASPTPAVQKAQFSEIFAPSLDVSKTGNTLVASNGAQNAHYIINGYHFIQLSVDGNGWDYSKDQVTWLDEQLAAAKADTGTDKPIFFFRHIGSVDSVVGTGHNIADCGVGTLDTVLAKYPMVVDFSGHSHFPINQDGSILQKDWTMLGTGTLNYASVPKYDGVKVQIADGTSIYDADHVYVVEVDANSNTRIRIWDLTSNEFLDREYLLDSYKKEGFKYTASRIGTYDIKFADDAEISLVKVTQNLVSFKFPTTDLDHDTPLAFRVSVAEKATGKTVATRHLGWSFWEEDSDAIITNGIGGLKPDTEYTVTVEALINAYNADLIGNETQVSSSKLTKAFKTATAEATDFKADILDIKIDADKKTVTDLSENAMKATVSGTPTFAFDSTIGMNTITFPNNESVVKLEDYKDDADSMAYGFTFEAYFKVNEYNCESGSKAPLGSEQSGGFGFDMQSDGTVTYSVYTGGYKTLKKTQEIGKYYHWVCVYDGTQLVCFVNGHKIGAVKAEAPITYNSVAAQVLFLGADTTGAGNKERQSRVSVALARLYSNPANDEQAIALYNEVAKLQDKQVYVDDSDDPEYLFWETVDDFDTEYVSFVDPEGTVHDHDDDDGTNVINYKNGGLGVFSGSHLYNSKCHFPSGDEMCKVSFTGTAFRYVLYYRGPADSYANGVNVFVDGELKATVRNINGNNLTSKYVAYELTGLEDKKHEIVLVSDDGMRFIADAFELVFGTGKDETGEPIPAPKMWTSIDAFETDCIGYYDADGKKCDVDTAINAGTDGKLEATETWQVFHGGHLQASSGVFGNYKQGAYAEFKFSGTAVRMITQYRGPQTSDIELYIDGVLVDIATGLSANNDTSTYNIFEKTGLSDTLHTVRVVAKDAKQMPVDYFKVIGTPIYTDSVPEAIISYKDTKTGDGKIDYLYINAVAPDNGDTYGILFAENTFATEANLKLSSDGGNPLFTKICKRYDALLESSCYGSAEITAANLGGAIDDDIIAFHWTNMTAYSTFAARVFRILENGTVIYGEITSVTLTDGSQLLPIE